MSFVPIDADSDFTYDNLPYGVFSVKGQSRRRVGVAIGSQVLDLGAIKSLFNGPLMKSNQVIITQIPFVVQFKSVIMNINFLACFRRGLPEWFDEFKPRPLEGNPGNN